MKRIVKIVLCSLLTLTVFAQIEDGVPPGFDIWRTVGNGNTFYSMEKEPIPSEFFCEGSAAFSGRLDFDGVPIKTHPAGALDKADTIIERLDFAPYDENGLAYSRMIARALNLKAQPLENECGTWDIDVSLTKNQPVTEVSYVRGEANYGYFAADLVLNFRITFTLRGEKQVQRELVRTVHFSRFTEIPYAVEYRAEGFQSEKRSPSSDISFDSNGDGTLDNKLAFAHHQEFPTITVVGNAALPAFSETKGAQRYSILCHYYWEGHMHCFCDAPVTVECDAPGE